MVSFSPAARLQIAIVAGLLSIPAVIIPTQNTEQLAQFHKRYLAEWPYADSFGPDPVRYFRQAGKWFADRIGFIHPAAQIQKAILMYALRTPPEHRITLGRDGFIFLNGPSEQYINRIFEDQCIHSHSDAAVANVAMNLPALVRLGRKFGVPLHSIAVPMMSTLYADHIPHSVPDKIRNACLAVFNDNSALEKVAAQRNLNFLYPFAEMKALRNEKGFFPQANFHPDGLSVKTVRDAYLKTAGLSPVTGETIELGAAPSELLETYGLEINYPTWIIKNANVGRDNQASAAISEKLSPLFKIPPVVTVFTNRGPASKIGLLLSDSVGIRAAPTFAGGFRRLIWVYLREMKQPENLEQIVEGVASSEHLDNIIVMLNEGSLLSFGALVRGTGQ
jgi:hypothetical protein